MAWHLKFHLVLCGALPAFADQHACHSSGTPPSVDSSPTVKEETCTQERPAKEHPMLEEPSQGVADSEREAKASANSAWQFWRRPGDAKRDPFTASVRRQQKISEDLDTFAEFMGAKELTKKVESEWFEFRDEYRLRAAKTAVAEMMNAQESNDEKPNDDRVMCRRDDDFDLVVPSDKYILRLATGSGAHNLNDVFVTADTVCLKRLDISVVMSRLALIEPYRVGDRVMMDVGGDEKKRAVVSNVKITSGKTWLELKFDDESSKTNWVDSDDSVERLGDAFDIQIGGQGGLDTADQEDLAHIEFELAGLVPYVKNKLMAQGLSWLTKYLEVAKKQHGSCSFHLTARVTGIFDASEGTWKVYLAEKKLNLRLEFADQGIINQLSSWFSGTIEEAVTNLIWDSLHKMLPASFAALTSEMQSTDLAFDVHALIAGGQEEAGSPLKLKASIESNIDTIPSSMLSFLTKNFDAQTLVDRYFNELINEQDLNLVWEINKDAVAKMLSRYGVSASWVQKEFTTFDAAKLKKKLLDAVAEGADAIVKGLRPFMSAQKQGCNDPFKGIAAAFGVKADWDEGSDRRGRANVQLTGRAGEDSNKVLTLPTCFMQAILGAGTSLIVPPKEGQSPSFIALERLSFARPVLSMASFAAKDLRVARRSNMNTTGDDGKVNTVSTAPIYKLSGGLRNLRITFPEDIVPQWVAVLHKCRCEIHPGGHVSVDLGSGVHLMQQERLPEDLHVESDLSTVYKHESSGTLSTESSTPSGTGSVASADSGVHVTEQESTVDLHESSGTLPTESSMSLDTDSVASAGEISCPASVETHRKGGEGELCGPVPAKYRRPTIALKNAGRLEVLPMLDVDLSVKASTKVLRDETRLVVTVTGQVEAVVNLDDIVKPLAASRPTRDTGYIFFAGSLGLYHQMQEEHATLVGEKKVVLNCGYLRVFDETNFQNKSPFDIVTFLANVWDVLRMPKAQAQIEIDLSDRPTVSEFPQVRKVKLEDGEKDGEGDCFSIVERDVRSWRGFGRHERLLLCGRAREHGSKSTEQQVLELAAAWALQVGRFSKDPGKTKELNYGTHDHRYNKKQFSLPKGFGTKQLSDILSLGGTVEG